MSPPLGVMAVRRASARTFWNDGTGCLSDVVGEDGAIGASLRHRRARESSLVASKGSAAAVSGR